MLAAAQRQDKDFARIAAGGMEKQVKPPVSLGSASSRRPMTQAHAPAQSCWSRDEGRGFWPLAIPGRAQCERHVLITLLEGPGGMEFLLRSELATYNLAIVDWMLPGLDGS